MDTIRREGANALGGLWLEFGGRGLDEPEPQTERSIEREECSVTALVGATDGGQ
jgi:hypothetical protein